MKRETRLIPYIFLTITIIILSLILLMIVKTETKAAEVKESGTCGENVFWTLDEDGLLTVSGKGSMYEYLGEGDPWDGDAFQNVVIEEGVTSIAINAFACCNLNSIILPTSLTEIGEWAFGYCSLSSIDLPDGVDIGQHAFYGSDLTSIVIPSSITYIGDYAFYGCNNLTDVYYGGTPESWGVIDKETIFEGAHGSPYPMIHFAQIDDGWYYQHGIWSYYKNNVELTSWQKIDGIWYYFKDNGAMATGWIQEGGKWYYLQASGAMATGWVKEGNTWYYMNSSGAMQTGMVKVGGITYYMAPSGAMQTGWIKYYESQGSISALWIYADANGALTRGWKYINGAWYYFNPDNFIMYDEGQYTINGKPYFFHLNGEMGTGWCKTIYKDGGRWYYANSNGVLQTGWQKINGTWYYFHEQNGFAGDCSMASNVCCKTGGKFYLFAGSGAWIAGSGWQKISDGHNTRWYYTQKGVCLTGWQKIEGVWYYFDPMMGSMVSENRVLDGKIEMFASSGAWKGTCKTPGWAKVVYSGWYYVEDFNGSLATGWRTINGVTYYFDPDEYYMYHFVDGSFDGRVYEIDGDCYCFNEDGALQTGVVDMTGMLAYKCIYYADESGKLQSGWQIIDGYQYYFNLSMYYDGYYEIDGVEYYFDEEGHYVP